MPEQPCTTIPHRYHSVNPYITVNDVPALLDFLRQTFGGVVTAQLVQPDGRAGHTEVRIGDSLLLIGAPQVDGIIPSHAETRPGTFYVYVDDVDSAYHRAMTCGASSWEAPTETFYGDRIAAVVDSSNNVWWLATRKQTYNWSQVQARANEHWRHGKQSV